MSGQRFGRIQVKRGDEDTEVIGYAWGLIYNDEFQVVYTTSLDVWGEGTHSGELSLLGSEAESFNTTVPAPDAALTALALYSLTGEVDNPIS